MNKNSNDYINEYKLYEPSPYSDYECKMEAKTAARAAIEIKSADYTDTIQSLLNSMTTNIKTNISNSLPPIQPNPTIEDYLKGNGNYITKCIMQDLFENPIETWRIDNSHEDRYSNRICRLTNANVEYAIELYSDLTHNRIVIDVDGNDIYDDSKEINQKLCAYIDEKVLDEQLKIRDEKIKNLRGIIFHDKYLKPDPNAVPQSNAVATTSIVYKPEIKFIDPIADANNVKNQANKNAMEIVGKVFDTVIQEKKLGIFGWM